MELQSKKTQKEYYEETKKYIMDTFCKKITLDAEGKEQIEETSELEKEQLFNTFIESEQQKFQVCTTTAGYISKHLKGYLGHHTLIRYKINGIKNEPLEYVFGPKKTPGYVDQYETERTVSGKKLFEMIMLDRTLQETHTGLRNAGRTYEIGSNDCRNYVDKILIGTGQPPTLISRFNKTTDRFYASKIVAPLISFFSRTKETEFRPFLEHFKDGNEPEIHTNIKRDSSNSKY